MGFLTKSKRSPPHVKHPTLGSGDEVAYVQGSGKPTAIRNLSTYQNSVERLDTAIRTLTDMASPARHSFYRKDAQGKFNKIKTPKQFNEEFTNDYQSYVDFNTSLFATMFRYNAALIVPETSKNKYRQNMVDFFVMDNNKWFLEAGSGSASIDKFTYRTSNGSEIYWNYEDVIYVLRSYDVTNPLYGVPKITALNNIINMEINTSTWASSYTGQGGKKSMIVSSEEWMSEENRSKIVTALREYLSATEAKILTINSDKVKVDTTSDSLGSNQIVELMAFINNSIVESFRIPPELLGKDLKSITDKSLRLAARICYELNISPMMTTIEAHISRYIQNVMGLKNIYFRFDRESLQIFDESELDRQELALGKFDRGIISPNETRVELGLEPINSEAMNQHYPPAYLQGTSLSYESLDRGATPPETTSQPSGPGGSLNGENMSGSSA